MATKTLVVVGDTSSFVPADTAANGSSVVLRDSSGNISAAQVAGTEVKTTGVETTAVKAVQTASTTLDGTAVVWPFNTTTGSMVPTLPAASSCAGRRYVVFKTVAANSLTITAGGSDTINGSATLVLSSASASAKLISDGVSNWYSI